MASVRCADDFEVSRGSARNPRRNLEDLRQRIHHRGVCVGTRGRAVSKIALRGRGGRETCIYRPPPFPPFPSLNDAFYAGVKTFLAKKACPRERGRSNKERGGTRMEGA